MATPALAEGAVISEPVSARWFPVPGENTGKFVDFGLEIAKAPRLSEENSIAYQQNSLVAKAGKICGRSGNPRPLTAKLIPLAGLAASSEIRASLSRGRPDFRSRD